MSILTKLSNVIQDYTAEFFNSDLFVFICNNKWTIAAGLIGAYCVYKAITWPRNLPPGPRGWPIVGAMGQLTDNFQKDLLRYSEEYKSDVISLYIGGTLTVGLNSADAIREAFLKSEDFADRGRFGELFDLKDEILSNTTYTERWRKLKSFIMSSLRTHGFGTPKSEDNILMQLDKVCEEIDEKPGSTFTNDEAEHLFTKATVCVFMKMIANQDYDFNDEELIDLINRIEGYQSVFFEEFFTVLVWFDVFPMWVVSLFIARDSIKRCKASAAGIRAILQRHLEEHRATLDKNNSRDYLDDNIIESFRDPSFTDRMITDTIIAFVPDGTETVSGTFVWCLFYLCLHPEYQEKMFNEISQVCGANRPSLKERGKLIICEAVILESFRVSSEAGVSGAHTCSKDVKFRGYTIPKGSSLQANLWAAHYDPKVFPEPAKFKPERFIKDGKLTNTENVMPFGLGRRKCPGEPLTRSEHFLYMTSLVLRYKFSFSKDGRPESSEGAGTFAKAPPCKIVFTPR